MGAVACLSAGAERLEALRNVLNEKPIPPEDLHGRLLHSGRFVGDHDLARRDVLDIGCGYGWFELYALSRGVRRCVGMEPTLRDLGTASRHIKDDRVRLVVGSAIALPFECDSFDTIVCWEVLEHIPQGGECRYFAEARRVLKSGGVLYLSTPCKSLASTTLDPAYWLIGHRHYASQDIRHFAERNRFEVASLLTAGGWWEIISWWNLYISKWVLRRKPLLSRVINGRLDEEFAMPSGFTNIFCKLVAI